MKRKEMFKTNKGITLVALVITIIILIILAGVSINLTVGQDGIITKAKRAKENMETAINEEEAHLAELVNKLNANSHEIEEIDMQASVIYDADYTKATLKIEITYEGIITKVKINGEEIEIPTKEENKYVIQKEILENGTYSIYIKNNNDGYKMTKVTSTEISEDMTIATVEELVAFRDKVNKGATFEGKTITLVNDLDLSSVCSNKIGSWEPIGNYGTDQTHYFSGTFIGNNHTISNIYINAKSDYQGLFGKISNGKIENLNIGTGTITGNIKTGGIAGQLNGEIINSTNNAIINGNDIYVGGITGIIDTGTIDNCINNGNITGSGHYVAGITGQTYKSCLVSNCTNNGIIEGGKNYTGGIVGAHETGSKVEKSYNRASITGNNYVGGIAGVGVGASQIENCNNTAPIKANTSYAGGIAGQTNGNITACYNTGKVTVNSTTGSYAGGIVGTILNNTTISSCYNKGEVSGHRWIGGIVGTSNNCTIEKNYNLGIISGNTHVGGIIGYSHSDSTIQACYNDNTISAEKYVGGIAGVQNASTIDSCYNKKSISATNIYSGGIAGSNEGASTIIRCYNLADVSASTNDKGAITSSVTDTSIVNYCYTLSTVSTTKIYYNISSTATVTNSTTKTDSEMKEIAFVTLLNTKLSTANWKSSTNSYPILSWQ